MKTQLPKGVETFPNEPCFSFLVRLAERNDISAFELASVSGTRWPNVKIGSHQAARACASLSGIDPRALRRATPRLIDKRLYGFVGTTLPDRLMRSADLRFCPSCAQEDVDAGHQPYIRSEWLLRAFRVCPIHQTPLIDLCSIDHLKYDCLSQTIARRLEDHRPGQNTRPDRPAFEQYLTSRINRVWTREKRWVDTLSLESLIESAELFGALFRFGKYKKSELSFDDWVAAAELGFSILENGKDELFQRLAHHTTRAEKRSLIGYAQCFGQVYAWLNKNREDPKHKEIVSTIHEFAERSLRTEHLTTFLGRPLTRVEGCSATRLAEVFDIQPKRVRVFLARSGVEPIGSIDTIMGQAVLYPDDPARQAVRKWLDLIDGHEARQLLDVTHSTFNSLVEHKIVRQHRFENLRGPRYSTRTLISLCRRLERLPSDNNEQDYDAIRDRMENLSSAARRIPCEIGELFRLLLQNELSRLSVTPKDQGIPDIQICINEAKERLQLPEPPGLTEQAAAAKLQLSVQAIQSLRKAGHLATIQGRNPETRKLLKRIDETGAIEFAKTFVSLFALADLNGLSRTAVAKLLESLDCPVAICVAKSPKFFRRSDVAKTELTHELGEPN